MTRIEVGIVIGTDADMPIMHGAVRALDELGIPSEVSVVSLERTFERLVAYATTAERRGLRVLIVGATTDADSAGIAATLSTLPVIKVPFEHQETRAGVPYTSVAMHDAATAGLVAASILAAHDLEVRDLLRTYKEREDTSGVLESLGYTGYRSATN